MRKIVTLALMLVPSSAHAQWDKIYERFGVSESGQTQVEADRNLNRAVQIEQLEHFEREEVRRDFEPFQGMFKQPTTPMDRAIRQAGEDAAVEQRTRQRLANPYFGR